MSQSILKMFWVAEYTDGMALPQYNPDTGQENLFKEITFSKLKRFGWYPFTQQMAAVIPMAVVRPFLPSCVIELNPEDKLLANKTVLLAMRISDNEVVNHSADIYALGIEGKYIITINALTNQITCK